MPLSSSVSASSVFAKYQIDFEAALRASLPATSDASQLFDLLRYHLGWLDLDLKPVQARTGKMLRPTLCLLSCEAVGGDYHRALPAATSLELLHNFSLIHDDIEDRGDERHGRPTVWARWGEPLAVNAGDAMLIASELALLSAIDVGLSADVTVDLLRILNECCLRLTEGQHLDMSNEGRPDLSEAVYFQIIARKTAALLGCSAQLGALSGGADADQAAGFKQFGVDLGIGFQIQDDILGIWGDPAVTGKPAAADVFGHKVTLPVIDALQRAVPEDRDTIVRVYRSELPTVEDAFNVMAILKALGTRERVEALAGQYVQRALGALATCRPQPAAADALRAVALSLVGRTA